MDTYEVDVSEGTDSEVVSSDADEFHGRRQATLYDAVAGRVSHQSSRQVARPKTAYGNAHILQHSARQFPHAPDEVLFRRTAAPIRYAEHDVYQAFDRYITDAGRHALPDSDLLKAIHGYSSKFYESTRHDRGGMKSKMDETALLALGILLEEAGREVLGRRGDLVFTEVPAASPRAEEPDAPVERAEPDGGRERKRRRMDAPNDEDAAT
ncbi:hypothetical protein B0I35DRAFT_405374 [Stachybotrys elegans]|uniref:Uncharacterized protein n=1 Tax=Stachybotrys elegans TaxID=80388 RepID=A0A8K0WW29_9HYPO|nr:hypothetical protein B0I35DRAFT_405374 [Stachybotrys elegans]